MAGGFRWQGIQLIPVAHGEAQLRTRWGKDGAQVILDTCGVKAWLPGITDTATLKMASDLCGQACFKERSWRRRERHRVWHDVLTPDMIRQLPARHALVIRGSYAPVIARLGAAWHDRAYKNARRLGTAVALLTAAPQATAPTARPLTASASRWPHLTVVPDLEETSADGATSCTTSNGYPWS